MDYQIVVINGVKYRKEKIACPFESNTFYVTGGWGPWIKPPTRHLALDGYGTGANWNKLQAGLDGVIIKPSDIPLIKQNNGTTLDKQGFAIKCNSGEYLHYHHCDLKIPMGSKVSKGQKGIGIISPDNDGSPNWQGPHCEWRVITSKGMIQIHPFDVQDRSIKLYRQYGGSRQYRDNHNTYIYTNLGSANEKEYYTVKKGGWRWNVVDEIIKAGIWQGTVNQNLSRFNGLNPVTPTGGWKAGNKVRIK